MSGTADRLLELIYDWIREARECSSNLRALAQELEDLRKACNIFQTVGNTVTVVGSVVATGASFFTFGIPLALWGAVAGGVGAGVSLITNIAESFESSKELKKIEEIDKKCNKIADKIKQLFDELRDECPSSEDDKQDQYVVKEFLKAMSRSSQQTSDRDVEDLVDLMRDLMDNKLVKNIARNLVSSLVHEVVLVLSSFSLQMEGKLLAAAAAKGGQQIGKAAAVRGASKFLGGVVLLAFTLPEAINNWKEAIKDKHETKASKSLRDTAKQIDKAEMNLSNNLFKIKEMLQKAVKTRCSTEEESEEYEESEEDEQNEESEESEEEQDEESEEVEQDEESEDEQDEEREEVEQDEESEDEQDEESEEVEQDEESEDEQDEESEEVEQDEESEDEQDEESEEVEQDEESEDEQDEESEEVEQDEESEEVEQDEESEKVEQDEESQEVKQDEERAEDELQMALVNACSINKFIRLGDTTTLNHLILENNLEVLLITETWLPLGTVSHDVLRDILPPNYRYFNCPRFHSRGGGLAVIFSDQFEGERIYFNFTFTFEYLAARLNHRSLESVLILIIYRPPPRPGHRLRFPAFLEEMETLLGHLLSFLDEHNIEHVVIAGDFNIWVDSTNNDARRFRELLNQFDLGQHVNESTHTRGHTLDLVLTPSTARVDVSSVEANSFSDHSTVFFTLKELGQKRKKKDEENKKRQKRDSK